MDPVEDLRHNKDILNSIGIDGESTIFRLLRKFNLTRRESEAYVTLLSMRLASARKLAQNLNRSRVDTYRILKNLTRRGLVTMTMSSPALFEAAPPRTVVRILLEEVREQAQKMKDSATQLILELESMDKSPVDSNSVNEGQDFKLVKGQAIWPKLEEMLANAKEEICGIWPISFMNSTGALSPLRDCSERGVRVQVVSDITRRNLQEVVEVLGSASVRHFDGILNGPRFTIVDRREAALGLTMVRADFNSPMSLWSTTKDLVEVLYGDFEIIWARSIDLKERIHELKVS